MQQTEQHAEHLETILDSIADGVFTVDKEWIVTSFNRAAEEITGIPREEAVGQRCCEVFRASICESACALRQTMKTGQPVINKAIYIIDSNGRRIPISISTALLKNKAGKVIGGVETFRDLSVVERLRKELEYKYTFEDIISKSPKMRDIFDLLPTIAQSDSTVLIEGESGTGKELIARAIHNLSPRKKGPLVAVNCGALPDNLLESELFGYKAGAFTDAKRDKPGRLALAGGGTILLDEIGDISPALQVKLLRVLQEKTYEPLGGVETRKINCRVIALTNRNLLDLVEKDKFRLDLYYRINVIRLVPPPLRERREDVPLLIDYFIEKFNKLYKKNITGVAPDTLSILMEQNYPGNVRQLENIIEHAFILCKDAIIEPSHLPMEYRNAEEEPELRKSIKTLEELEANFLESALRRNKWNRQKTADELGVHKTTLFRKIKRLNITMPQIDGRFSEKT